MRLGKEGIKTETRGRRDAHGPTVPYERKWQNNNTKKKGEGERNAER